MTLKARKKHWILTNDLSYQSNLPHINYYCCLTGLLQLMLFPALLLLQHFNSKLLCLPEI